MGRRKRTMRRTGRRKNNMSKRTKQRMRYSKKRYSKKRHSKKRYSKKYRLKKKLSGGGPLTERENELLTKVEERDSYCNRGPLPLRRKRNEQECNDRSEVCKWEDGRCMKDRDKIGALNLARWSEGWTDDDPLPPPAAPPPAPPPAPPQHGIPNFVLPIQPRTGD